LFYKTGTVFSLKMAHL